MSLGAEYWKPPPVDSFEQMTPEDIANRVIFIFGQCINFCYGDEDGGVSDFVGSDSWLGAREAKASALEAALDSWSTMLPASMRCVAAICPAGEGGWSDSPSMWFMFPQSGEFPHTPPCWFGLP
jgi:hypothetical protein